MTCDPVARGAAPPITTPERSTPRGCSALGSEERSAAQEQPLAGRLCRSDVRLQVGNLVSRRRDQEHAVRLRRVTASRLLRIGAEQCVPVAFDHVPAESAELCDEARRALPSRVPVLGDDHRATPAEVAVRVGPESRRRLRACRGVAEVVRRRVAERRLLRPHLRCEERHVRKPSREVAEHDVLAAPDRADDGVDAVDLDQSTRREDDLVGVRELRARRDELDAPPARASGDELGSATAPALEEWERYSREDGVARADEQARAFEQHTDANGLALGAAPAAEKCDDQGSGNNRRHAVISAHRSPPRARRPPRRSRPDTRRRRPSP